MLQQPLIHNSDNVLATVQRFISGAKEDWHFLSSPFQSRDSGSSWVPSGTYGNGTGYDLYIWNEPTPCWTYQLNTAVAPTWPSIHPLSTFVKEEVIYILRKRLTQLKNLLDC
jgi:hypothetical protein